MKVKQCCIMYAVLLAFVFCGCAAEAEKPVASASVSTVQEGKGASAPRAPEAEGSQERENADAESTTVTGEYSTEASELPDPSATPIPAASFTYGGSYEGDGYSFRYPQGTELIGDEETVKSFLLPGQEYALNVTRLNLSGQDGTLEQALPVYKKALEEQGNEIVGTETVQGFPYDNALIEMKMKEGSSTLNSVQVFFLAEEYNYTFTVSSHGGEMDTMKEIVTKIVKSFTTG